MKPRRSAVVTASVQS